MGPTLALAYRHALGWFHRLYLFLPLYVVGPAILLYGLSMAFGLKEHLPAILPGIMVNSAAATAFISCTYGTMERFYGRRYESWLVTLLTVPKVVVAEAIFQAGKGQLTSTGIWVAGALLSGVFQPLTWLGSLPVIMIVSVTTAMLGYCVVSLSRSYDDLALTDPFVTAALVFSGVFVAIEIFPSPIQWFAMVLPIYHGIEIIRPLFVGTPWGWDTLGHLALLLLMALGWGALAIHLFKRRLLA